MPPNDLNKIHKNTSRAKRISLAGILICTTGMIPYAITGNLQIILVGIVALLFSIANYAANGSAKANIELATHLNNETIALSNENANLQRELANAEELKMYEIRYYNNKWAKYYKDNQ